MTPDSPELLTILLGSYKEQKDLINSKPWTENDLIYIWEHVAKSPTDTDSSNLKAYEIHKALLRHINLPKNIVSELFKTYEHIAAFNLKPEIYRHNNMSFDIYIQKFNQAVLDDNFLELSWLMSSSNEGMSIMTKTLSSDESLVTRWKYLWELKNNSNEGNLIQQCFSKVVMISEDKGFLNSFFYWLDHEKKLNGSWCHAFIKNFHTNSKILTSIINKHSRNLGEYQFIELLNHPSANIKIISLLLTHFNSQPKESRIYNELLRLVRLNNQLTNDHLHLIFHMYPQHSELVELIIKHPSFSVSVIWQSFLHDKLFETLPSNLQQLLKNCLKKN